MGDTRGKVYFGNSSDVDRIRCILRGRSGKYGRSSADYRRSFGFPGDGTDDVRVICAGLLAVILFFVIDFVVARVYDLICRIPFIATWTKIGAIGWSLWDVVYFIVVCLILFGVSGLLAEKKLSV